MLSTPRERTVATIRKLRRFRLAKPGRKWPRTLQPDTVRLAYYKELDSRVLNAMRQGVVQLLLPELKAHRDADRLDGFFNNLVERIVDWFWKRVAPSDLEDLADFAARRTNDFQKNQFDRQVRTALGVDVFRHEPQLRPLVQNFVSENVALIKSLPTQYFSEIERIVTANVTSGVRHEQIAQALEERFKIADSRAKLIARDQVGKFYGQLSQTRQEALGVSRYIWRTVRDNRVRDEHRVREGLAFSWDKPPPDGIPGQAINCRCFAEPILSDIVDDL